MARAGPERVASGVLNGDPRGIRPRICFECASAAANDSAAWPGNLAKDSMRSLPNQNQNFHLPASVSCE